MIARLEEIDVSQIVYQGKLAGAFHGFNSDMLFKLANGAYLVQARYKYWYKYKYRPDVVVTKDDNNHLILTVEDRSIPVRPISVVESKIAGTFEGWKGNSAYKLINGQVWQQSKHKYIYKYAFRPDVLIYDAGGGHIMKVADTEAMVKRIH